MRGIGNKVNGYLQEYQVEGEGDFPIDMLRYDSAWPAREDQVSRIQEVPLEKKYGQTRVVDLHRFSFNGEGPHEARWESFGWRVIEIR